jgi:hypothetical protein
MNAVSDRLGAGCFDGRQPVGQNRFEDVVHLTIAIVGTGELAPYTFDRSRKYPVHKGGADALKERHPNGCNVSTDAQALENVKSVIVHSHRIKVTVLGRQGDSKDGAEESFEFPWTRSTAGGPIALTEEDANPIPDPALLQSIVRAHVWLQSLQDGTHNSIEALAEANRLHPKVVRLALRLALLSPGMTAAALTGSPSAEIASLTKIPRSLPLFWPSQLNALT